MLKILLFLFVTTATANGQCLSGDCANGEGTCVINKETIYTGSFKNNLPDGKGVFKNADYVIYSGEVKNGLYNGKGTLYYDNGDVYIGQFMNGMRHGKGEYRDKDGIHKGEFHFNGIAGTDLISDAKNKNGIYTSYAKIDFASMSNDKVAIFSSYGVPQNCAIYNAGTGQLLEYVKLLTLYDHNATNLYLDFGPEFFDTATGNPKIYANYYGKTVNGEAIFSQWNSKSEVTRLFTLRHYKDKPHVIYKFEGGQYHVIKAVMPDLSKIIKDDEIITLANPKQSPVHLKAETNYSDYMSFTPSGDSLFFNHNAECQIYSTATGEMLGKAPQIDFHTILPTTHPGFSANPYCFLSMVPVWNGYLVIVENAFNKDQIMPLIDLEMTSIGADVYWTKELKNTQDKIAFEEREHKEFVKKMEARYGVNWNKDDGSSKIISNKPHAATEVKCSFCNGSGVTSNYVTGQEITQDKTSGRWYHLNLAKTGTCPMCHGTGYRKK